MKKWNVTISLQTGVYLEEVSANDPLALYEGDLSYNAVVTALIDQLQSGQATLDWVVEEVETLDGVTVCRDDEDHVWMGDVV
jgi:hypothetical protein